MAEWSNATVLKTVVPKGTGGSNPSLSAQINKMEYKDILKYGEIQYITGRLDELYKGYVPNSTSKDNRIVDSRISKYEEKLKSLDEVSFYLYVTERKNKVYSKERGKNEIKSLLSKCLELIEDVEIRNKIINQIEKY
jgi:hypothetical protein